MIKKNDFLTRIIIILTLELTKKLPASATLDEMYTILETVLRDKFVGRGK